MFSQPARRLGVHLAKQSTNGHLFDPMTGYEEVAAELGISVDEAEEAADELRDHGLLKRDHEDMVIAENRLFWEFDREAKGWDTRADAHQVAALLVSEQPPEGPKGVADRLGWEPRRLNPALTYLREHGYIEAESSLGSAPFFYDFLIPNVRTRRFAKGTL